MEGATASRDMPVQTARKSESWYACSCCARRSSAVGIALILEVSYRRVTAATAEGPPSTRARECGRPRRRSKSEDGMPKTRVPPRQNPRAGRRRFRGFRRALIHHKCARGGAPVFRCTPPIVACHDPRDTRLGPRASTRRIQFARPAVRESRNDPAPKARDVSGVGRVGTTSRCDRLDAKRGFAS